MPATYATLIADRDKDFLKSIENDPISRSVLPRIAVSGREVLALLSRGEPEYCGFFINPRVSIPYGTAVFRACKAQCPRVPAYALLDPGETLPEEAEIKQVGLAGVVTKPVSYRDLIAKVRPDLLDYAPVASAAPSASAERSDEDTVSEDSVEGSGADFIPILAKDFLSGSVAQFDVFVQVSMTRFLKILRMGDAFDRNRVESYLRKGVTHFFVRREDQARLMQFTGTLSSALVKKMGVEGGEASDLAFAQAMAHGDQVMHFLLGGATKENDLEYARRFTRNLRAIVPHLKHKSGSSEFSSLLDKVVAHEHSVAVSMVASLLSKEMGFDSEGALHQVGVACLMHDVAIVKFSPDLDHEDTSRMDEAQKVRYRGHPKQGADYLASLKVVPEGVIQAVMQHHERRDGSGFPSGLSGRSIHRVAEIIGAAEELVRGYEKASIQAGATPAFVNRTLEQIIERGFSANVVNAYEEIFLKKKRTPGSGGTPRGGSPARRGRPRGSS
ncbi:MAG TPA: HD domain-containing phosphohydrolase [Bdellovibrionota bacterium]|nr:HD domain-containing phosphohydrolase [Bdellovibrionota bacterium]